MQTSEIIQHYSPERLANLRQKGIGADSLKDIIAAASNDLSVLGGLGIGLDKHDVSAMSQAMGFGQDAALLAPLTTASVPAPIQFLQYWLPGNTDIITAARKIDMLTGVTIAGSFADEEIVQQVVEYTGTAREYGDFTNIPLANWNTQY